MRSFKEYVLIFCKGIGMGAADVVPGVSGGTIALLTGIYEELLETIKSVNLNSIKLFFQGKFKEFWTAINGNFILALLTGIGFSLVLLSRLITYLLEAFPIYIWSFFFGLVIISSYMVSREVKRWDIKSVLMLLIGIAVAYGVTVATPAHTPDSNLFIFLSGLIAISAMILPGISGSFMLLIMGKYSQIIHAIKDFDIMTILIFGAGCIVGITSFSRLISWLLKKYHNMMMALLSGFMIGSLNKLWPWKEVIETRLNSKGMEVPFIEKSISPIKFEFLTGNDALLMPAVFFMLFGIGFVYGIEYLALKLKKEK
ncbi:DUF368 domain-containing protein [Aureibacter tunicatorum]|uniref:Membrane protein n=1 Tax=Aureibacter tunicatorum TaxID=866807 RepID=A0AAE3XK16_9BACT|nr:DUF368 domain-containing protein [Aureibacter tunicatorum]MDR6237847.1 putative membrane protein [Aureibacter tunicatorum]BDD02882.1 DUF368 domain-containing protein [Aureibacter tunicatorum]